MQRTSSILAALLVAATPALAQQSAPRAMRDSSQKLGAVQITATASGQGEARAVNAVNKGELRQNTAGSSALKALTRLPGINFQSADPWGAYEWSTRITVRGFQTQQIGQTFDGLPLGDMSYGNFNGLGVNRAVDSENLAGAGVAQGNGALGTASANNLGGVIQYASDAPRANRAFSFRQTTGMANTWRSSLRWDTGLWSRGSTGASAFLSFSRHDNDKWKGGGVQMSPENKGILTRNGIFSDGQTWHEQVNAKALAFVGSHKFTAFYSFSNRSEADYTDLSLARFKASGRDWDQFTDWNTAKQFATTSGQQDEAYWQSALGARRDNLAYVMADFALGEKAHLVVQPYFHANQGNGDWTAPSYGSTWSPDPIYFRQTQYDGERMGTNARVIVNALGNDIEAGLWYESNTTNIRRQGWRLVNYATGPTVDFANTIRLFFDRTGEITTTMAYLQNTNRLVDGKLKLTYGAKFLNVGADFKSNGNTANAASFGDPGRPTLNVTAKGSFLPQVGAVWQLGGKNQLFTNYTENINQYPLSPQSGVYNLSAAGFDAFKANVKPERATSVDFGIRTKREKVEASLATYFVNYRNRLVGTANCQLTATCASIFSNVGTISSNGVEGLLSWQIAPSWNWASTASYNNSTINDDYTSGTTVIAAKGKSVVDAPKIMANTTLRFDNSAWSGSLGARHVDKRYFSVLNDMAAPAYTVADAGIGYRLGRLGAAKDVSIQVNVTNLLDESYIATVGTGGFSVSGDLQTLMAGAKRLAFFSIGASF